MKIKRVERISRELDKTHSKEKINMARLRSALARLEKTSAQRLHKIKLLEASKSQPVELHRLRRAVVCHDFLQRLFDVTKETEEDRSEAQSHSPITVAYYRKTYDGVSIGRRYAKCIAKGGTKLSKPSDVSLLMSKLLEHHGRQYELRHTTMQAAPSEIRVLLIGDRCRDLDMVNAFIKLAVWMADKYGVDVPSIEVYSQDAHRESAMQELMDCHNVDKKTAKRAALIILHGGTYNDFLRIANRENDPSRVQLYKNMERECGDLRRAALSFDGEVERRVQKARSAIVAEGGKSDVGAFGDTPVNRSLFSLICQTYEDLVLSTIESVLKTHNIRCESKQFDGLIVECPPRCNVDAVLRHVEKVVEEAHSGLKIGVKEKELFRLPHSPIIEKMCRV